MRQVITTRGKYPSRGYQGTNGSPNNERTSFIKVEVCTDITAIDITLPGYYIDQPAGFADTINPNSIQVWATLRNGSEISSFKFGGQDMGNITPGTHLTSDQLSISIAKGTLVTISVHVKVADGGTWYASQYLDSANGEGLAPYNTNYTSSSSPPGLSSGWGFTPIAVSGEITAATPSVLGIGDSINGGANHNQNIAPIERILNALKVPYSNMSVRGFSAGNFLNNTSSRAGITKAIQALKFTHAIINIPGANDLQGSITAQQMFTMSQQMESLLISLGIPNVAHFTLMPVGTGSSDNLKSIVGQTMRTQNAIRASFHQMMRDANMKVIEIAKTVSVNSYNVVDRDGAYWKFSASEDWKYSDDMVHPTTYAIDTAIALDSELIASVNSFLQSATPVTPPTFKLFRKFN